MQFTIACGGVIYQDFTIILYQNLSMAVLCRWITSPPQLSCEVVSPYYYKVIPPMGFVTIELDVRTCTGVR